MRTMDRLGELAAVLLSPWRDQRPIYGACGVEGCLTCLPMYDDDNEPVA